jgi:hypothetical protein
MKRHRLPYLQPIDLRSNAVAFDDVTVVVMDSESWDSDTRVKVNLLIDRLIELTGETDAQIVLRSLDERLTRLTKPMSQTQRAQRVFSFLEASVWPRKKLRHLSPKEETQILGYGPEGV